MTNNIDVKLLINELEKTIDDGVELFKYYKDISKDFQEQQKNLMNNEESKKIFANLKQKYDEEMKLIMAQRKGILKRRQSKKLSESDEKLSKLLNAELENKEKALENNYKKELINRKEARKKLSDMYVVPYEKIFLKEKEKLRKEKKTILSRIKIALAKLKKKMLKKDFTDFIKTLKKSIYNVSATKTITFMQLINHLEAGEITEEAAKRTTKINDLKTINNIDNRKSEIEYEIEKIKKENKESKKNNEKIKLMKILIEIKENVKKIFKKNFKGNPIPKDLSLIIKMLDQQKLLSKDDKEMVKILKKKLKSIVSKIQQS